jgi:non-lysosomal glucosylceramidase
MHLGGIGTGNFEIGADGQLTTWQLFNTLRDGQVPFYFAVKAGHASKLLQTTGGPDWPRVKQIEMTGEYPFATLRFRDDDLPVQLELEAFSPLEPLNTKLSSLPLAVFRFRIRNPTSQPQTVSLAALMINPVGYEAKVDIHGISHPNFGGNINDFFREGQAAGLLMRAEAGEKATLDRAVSIYTLANLQDLTAPPIDRPENLKVEILKPPVLPASKLTDPTSVIIWLEEAATTLSESFLSAAREMVRAGGTLVFSGAIMPLLQEYAAVTDGKPLNEAALRPDILFEDFEHGYLNWKIEGEAFGQEPAHGTLPNQQPVSGFIGKSLVNSFVNGDDTTGKLTSQSFVIARRFIRFLIGGGHYLNTQIRLIISDRVCRATSGKDNERLEPASWDVREFAGQTAHIEIVDNQKGEWGHINIDQIVFSDQPTNYAVMELLEELLPARFSNVQELAAQPDESGRVRFENQAIKAGSEQRAAKNGLPLLIGRIGKGKVILAAGQILDPLYADMVRPRQLAYAMLCELVGADYVPAKGPSPESPGFGTLALATLGQNPTVLVGFEDWAEAWEPFSKQGCFLAPESAKSASPTLPGQTLNGALATTVSVPAGGTVEVPFFLAWHYANSYFYRNKKWIGCYYATRWTDARDVIREAMGSYATLRKKTGLFHDTFYDSTLPYWLLDCVTANLAIIRHSGVVFRIANGDIYGWEGSNGCCDPTCTHVWGYEQSLARLFPDLERAMRRIDYLHQQKPDGGINNRTDVPSPSHPTGEHPFADGHASCILKAYREALNSPDDSFFREYWPHVKRAVEYLIARDAKASNGQTRGLLQDDQWNTYDEALHGVTTFISGYYLAALRAGEEWARRMDDVVTADRFHEIFESGQKKLVELCWNGEYFQQYLPDYLNRKGEVGPGCMSDQLIGQWWAHQLGLGYILPKDNVLSALHSIFKYNWKSDLTGWKHAPRAFAGANDKGLIICTWPKGGRPANVMLYSDEVWTGIEYQVAAHMIYEGLLEEGFSIVKGARDRYDGIPRLPIGRNPWCEIECGGHYARAMSSWSLLLALSGCQYDSLRHALRFTPCYKPDNFKCFFCASEGWGSLTQKSEGKVQRIEIAVKSGKLLVKILELTVIQGVVPHGVTAVLGGKTRPITFAINSARCHITFDGSDIIVNAGERLEIILA